MENQVSTIVCPNCGANTTNRKNCEYCGSVLVRFVDQNVAIDQNVFGKNALSFSSVATALKKNLEMQNDLSPTDVVLTEIMNGRKTPDPDIWVYGGNVTSETRYCFSARHCFNIADANIPSSSEPRLILCFTTPVGNSKSMFKRSCYANLFSSADIPIYLDKDGTLRMIEKIGEKGRPFNRDLYYLDMGQDYESATKIITDIYQTIYGVSEDEIEVKTEKLSLEQQRNYVLIRFSESSGCSVALLPILGIGAGIAAGVVKLISHLLV